MDTRIMLKKIFVICVFLFWGCSGQEKKHSDIRGVRYAINKIIFIDGSIGEGYIGLPESCLQRLHWEFEKSLFDKDTTEHNSVKNVPGCPRLVKEQVDTVIYSSPKVSSQTICNSSVGECMRKPTIYLTDRQELLISFCKSKYHVKMSFDSLNISRDFDREGSAWDVPYEIIVSDTLVSLNGLRNDVKILFYIEKKDMCNDCSPGLDVSKKINHLSVIFSNASCEGSFF